MFGHNHYVPILKLRMGETKALQYLKTGKELITPLFEIPPVPWDYANDTPAKTLAEHTGKTISNIASCWGSSPFFFDMRYIREEIKEDISDSGCKMAELYQSAIDSNLRPIPVISPNMGSDYERRIFNSHIIANTGICIRLESEDLDDDEYGDKLLNLVDTLKASPEQIDIIIDLGRIPKQGVGPYVAGLKNIIRFFPKITNWRTFTIAATSFPESMSDFQQNTADTTPRAEWDMWQRVIKSDNLRRLPSFSDFGISTPEPFEMDPRMMRLGAKIKYTLDTDWLIVKGMGISRGGSEQFHNLAALIANSKYFYGANFSWGDKRISECANRTCGPGNQTTWVTVGMNHHFAVVAEQISNLGEA